MKKKKVKNLSLSRNTISNLSHTLGGHHDGGVNDFSGGCTDGCGPFGSYWNCTKGGRCTSDCSNAHGGLTCEFKSQIDPC